jgi:hypothetical protein
MVRPQVKPVMGYASLPVQVTSSPRRSAGMLGALAAQAAAAAGDGAIKLSALFWMEAVGRPLLLA